MSMTSFHSKFIIVRFKLRFYSQKNIDIKDALKPHLFTVELRDLFSLSLSLLTLQNILT